MNPIVIGKMMKVNGIKNPEAETVIALTDYLESLASKVIKNAYDLARHAGEKLISLKSMKIAIALIINERNLNIDFEY